jgi:hypothetical protein
LTPRLRARHYPIRANCPSGSPSGGRWPRHPLRARTRALADLGARVVLGPLEHPSPLVVDDEGGYGVNCVTARNRSPDWVDHNVAAAGPVLIAAIVGQFGQYGASDAAACE